MESVFRYRSQEITPTQVEFIRQLIAEHPGFTRRRLSLELCEAWGWKQANGAPRDMVCRGLLLGLYRAGHIALPPAKQQGFNPAARYRGRRWKAEEVAVDTTPLAVRLSALRPLEVRLVRRTPGEALFNSLIEQYHPLRYIQPVGEHLKYLVSAADRPIACLAWSSAPRHLGRATTLSAGRQRRAAAIFVFLPTIRASSLCLGFESHTWPRTSWGRWRAGSRAIGNRPTGIRFIFWKRSLIPSGIAAPVIGRRTGW